MLRNKDVKDFKPPTAKVRKPIINIGAQLS
jgi:hypothetical protein